MFITCRWFESVVSNQMNPRFINALLNSNFQSKLWQFTDSRILILIPIYIYIFTWFHIIYCIFIAILISNLNFSNSKICRCMMQWDLNFSKEWLRFYLCLLSKWSKLNQSVKVWILTRYDTRPESKIWPKSHLWFFGLAL